MDFDEDPNYLDLDDILAQTQTVKCKFLLNIPGLEFLSPGNSQEATEGTELLLPFWMAKTLYTYSMIDVELPKTYSSKFRELLSADATVVNLHRHGPYYYSFGKLLMELQREKGNNLPVYTTDGTRNKYRREEGETLEERRSIAASLLETFHQRRHKLIDFSLNAYACESASGVRAFESRLDNMEKILYELGKKIAQELNEWKGRKCLGVSKRRKLENAPSLTSSSSSSSKANT